MGRAPDHVASCISGMYMGLDVFEAYDGARARALADYYRYARDNDLYLTYVIINPQADRSKSAGEQQDEFLTAGVVDRDSAGHHDSRRQDAGDRRHHGQRGARHLHPAAAAGRREATPCPFAIPMNTKGLKILSRKSYEEEARQRLRQSACRAASTKTTPCSTSTTSRCRGTGSS